MGYPVIGYPNHCDPETVFTGGSWRSTLPLSNLGHRALGKVARSTDLQIVSTQFVADLGAARTVRIVGLVGHNLGSAATVRIRASASSDFSASGYDSGWINAWYIAYTSTERDGSTASFIYILPANKTYRYWSIEISNTGNGAGYVQLGRLFLGEMWQFTAYPSYGATLGWESATTLQTAMSGTEYFSRRPPARVARFVLDRLTKSESFDTAFELMRRAGIDQELIYIHDPDDTDHAHPRWFMGRLRQLSPIEFPYWDATRVGFEIKELL